MKPFCLAANYSCWLDLVDLHLYWTSSESITLSGGGGGVNGGGCSSLQSNRVMAIDEIVRFSAVTATKFD